MSDGSDLASAQPEPYWSVTGAAKRLFMGPDAARSRIARGELVAVRTTAGHMILESELRGTRRCFAPGGQPMWRDRLTAGAPLGREQAAVEVTDRRQTAVAARAVHSSGRRDAGRANGNPGGGRCPHERDVPYVLPRHPGEVDRLDIQHFALQAVLGANHLAPVGTPATVLDVGAGTGQWAYEVCAQFPEARVVGVDLVDAKPGAPSNYHAVRANVLDGLPFGDGGFDFVHQRLLFAGVPLLSWPAVVAELVRVARPGGWVELVEGATELENAGPATERLAELLRRLGRTRNLDSTGVVFRSLDSYLTRAGAVGVRRRTVRLPVGEWGGLAGSLMATDFRALFTRLADAFAAAFDVTVEECHGLVREARLEWEARRTAYSVAIAYGWKPS